MADPWADPAEVRAVYGLYLTPLERVQNADCIIHAVAHRQFHDLGPEGLYALYRQGEGRRRAGRNRARRRHPGQ